MASWEAVSIDWLREKVRNIIDHEETYKTHLSSTSFVSVLADGFFDQRRKALWIVRFNACARQ